MVESSPVESQAVAAVSREKYDHHFFWLWHSAAEIPLPFARVEDLAEPEVTALHEHLQRMADETFATVDCSTEKCLTPYNMHISGGCEWRVVTEDEIRIHKTSLHECIAKVQMEYWLQLCECFPKGAWKPTDADTDAEPIDEWCDQLHEWSERAIEELRRVRGKLSAPNAVVGPTNPVSVRVNEEASATQATKTARDQVFISYSHKDKKFHDDLLAHLKPYVQTGAVTSWSDKQILAGSKWFAEIQAALAKTRVAVLLVTPNFLSSDFIRQHELGPLLKEAEAGGVTILWVLVRACSYEETSLNDYQAIVSPPEKPLAEMKAERDSAWKRICQEIKKASNP